jgi:hypothetical protein
VVARGESRSPLREAAEASGAAVRFGAGIVAVAAAQLVGALRRH